MTRSLMSIYMHMSLWLSQRKAIVAANLQGLNFRMVAKRRTVNSGCRSMNEHSQYGTVCYRKVSPYVQGSKGSNSRRKVAQPEEEQFSCSFWSLLLEHFTYNLIWSFFWSSLSVCLRCEQSYVRRCYPRARARSYVRRSQRRRVADCFRIITVDLVREGSLTSRRQNSERLARKLFGSPKQRQEWRRDQLRTLELWKSVKEGLSWGIILEAINEGDPENGAWPSCRATAAPPTPNHQFQPWAWLWDLCASGPVNGLGCVSAVQMFAHRRSMGRFRDWVVLWSTHVTTYSRCWSGHNGSRFPKTNPSRQQLQPVALCHMDCGPPCDACRRVGALIAPTGQSDRCPQYIMLIPKL